MPRFLAARPPRFAAAYLLGALALACASCGLGGKKVYPVEGKVLWRGQPAAGAFVFFHPAEGGDFTKGDQPHGVVGDDGVFRVTTYRPADGAPPGKYTVTVHWERKAARGDDGEVLFPAYDSPSTSPLRAEVREGPTVLEPFQLPPG